MAKKEDGPITYASTGVNYEAMDPLKRLAQREAAKTSSNIERFGFKIIELSRGESALVIDEGDRYSAHVIEGLGTKNLVANQLRIQKEIADSLNQDTKKTYYDYIAQDTIAMVVNDLITVGADPVLVNAYWAMGSSGWFSDQQRLEDLVKGWRKGCDLAGAAWGGGETPILKGIIGPEAIDLAGSGYGVIKPKQRLTLGDKLTPGDAIFLVESSGIHANGLTLARTIASKLPEGYVTPLSDGKSYGESLLAPTHIYACLTRDLFEAGIDIHYMVNITGHGWRKLMRANRDLSYIIDQVPHPQPVFRLIQEQSGNDDAEMYGNFNMGAGLAIFMPDKDVELAQKIAMEKYRWQSGKAGQVESGPRQVVIKPKNLVYQGETLGVR